MLAKRFARVDVRQVHLDKRDRHRQQASRRATLVWVRPAGLNMMNRRRLVGASWIRSISSYSALLCKAHEVVPGLGRKLASRS